MVGDKTSGCLYRREAVAVARVHVAAEEAPTWSKAAEPAALVKHQRQRGQALFYPLRHLWASALLSLLSLLSLLPGPEGSPAHASGLLKRLAAARAAASRNTLTVLEYDARASAAGTCSARPCTTACASASDTSGRSAWGWAGRQAGGRAGRWAGRRAGRRAARPSSHMPWVLGAYVAPPRRVAARPPRTSPHLVGVRAGVRVRVRVRLRVRVRVRVPPRTSPHRVG